MFAIKNSWDNRIAKFLGYKSTKNYLLQIKYIVAGIDTFNYYTSFNDYFSQNQWGEVHDSFSHFLNETTGFRKYFFLFYGTFLMEYPPTKKRMFDAIRGEEDLLQAGAEAWERLDQIIDRFNSMFKKPPTFRDEYNKKYIEKMLTNYEEFFDKAFPNKLTYEQRLAIIVDEDNNYINAGAGCGKTQTVISKVVYLVKKKNINPEKILVLVFNKNAQIELSKRLSDLNIEQVTIKTFHSFGFNVYKDAVSSKKELIFADRNESRTKFIQEKIDSILLKENPQLTKRAIHYFAYLLDPPKEESPKDIESRFKSLKEYEKYLKQGDMRSLNGVYLKSKQEVMVANFLYLNSIEFEYEKKYPHQEKYSIRNDYEPDFYLSKYDVWLEHFAFNKDNNGNLIPVFVGYKDGYDWKIQEHEAHDTKLLSTFSYQFSNGEKEFQTTLKSLLVKNGIKLKKRSSDDVVKDLKKYKGPTITKFAQLVETFLSLIKSAEKNPAELLKNLNKLEFRNKEFLELFMPVYKAYQKKLGSKYMDFDDMIGLASKSINKGKVEQNKYQYIMVDEFQDIGLGRFNLINALKKQNSGSKFLCVGDDWQAIYRFTGGDVNILFEFEKYFGSNSEELRLTQSFRLSNQLAKISNKFIRKNEKQSDKEIQSTKQVDIGIHIFFLNDQKTHNKRLKVFEKIFKKINDLTNGKKATVLILNRYNYEDLNEMYFNILNVLQKKYPQLKAQNSTIHQQKGAEFDYVILDDLVGDFIGFPNKMGEDPVLHMVMEKPEEFLDAEERRVFYVGITRSKLATFIIANRQKPSSFFEDIKKEGGVKIYDDSLPCHECGDGIMVLRVNSKTKEKFYSCSDYPDCNNNFDTKYKTIYEKEILEKN